jgi:hypothetical protein
MDLSHLLPAAQVAELRKAMELWKNMKSEPLDLSSFTFDRTFINRIP